MKKQSRIQRIIGWLDFSERHMLAAINGLDGNTYSDRAIAKDKETLKQLRADRSALKNMVN